LGSSGLQLFDPNILCTPYPKPEDNLNYATKTT
jgi:hypothetical protein